MIAYSAYINFNPRMAWLYQQKGSANWWIGYRANGKQFLRTTGTPDRKKAEKELAKVETMFGAHRAGSLTQELFEILSGKALPKKTLLAEVREWLNECAGTTAKGTLDRYKSVMDDFTEYLEATERGPLLAEIESEQARAYLIQKRTKASAATVNLERKILSAFFLRAVRNGNLKANPMLAVKRFKDDSESARRPFTATEVKLLFEAAGKPDAERGKATPNGPFWQYMIVAGFYTGLRMGDLVTLSWRAVDFQKSQIHVIARKTNKPLHIPMAAPLEKVLMCEWTRRGRPSTGHVWPEKAHTYERAGAGGISNEFYEILTACGLAVPRENKQAAKSGRGVRREVSPLSFHCLRHSFVTLLKATGASNAVAKELAGHSSDAVNALYTHMPAETLAGAIAQLPEVTK